MLSAQQYVGGLQIGLEIHLFQAIGSNERDGTSLSRSPSSGHCNLQNPLVQGRVQGCPLLNRLAMWLCHGTTGAIHTVASSILRLCVFVWTFSSSCSFSSFSCSSDPTFLGEPLTIAMAQTNLARGISRVRIAKNGIPPTMPTGSVVWKTGRCSSTCHLITMTLQSDWK